MNKITKFASLSFVIAALVAPAATAFAATPSVAWTTDGSVSYDEFKLGLGYAPDAGALADAQSVRVVSFGSTSPNNSAYDDVARYAPTITATQNAISADPQDVALLQSHGVPVSSVLAIDDSGNGKVTVYTW